MPLHKVGINCQTIDPTYIVIDVDFDEARGETALENVKRDTSWETHEALKGLLPVARPGQQKYELMPIDAIPVVNARPEISLSGALSLVRIDGDAYLRMGRDIDGDYFGPLSNVNIAAFKLLCEPAV